MVGYDPLQTGIARRGRIRRARGGSRKTCRRRKGRFFSKAENLYRKRARFSFAASAARIGKAPFFFDFARLAHRHDKNGGKAFISRLYESAARLRAGRVQFEGRSARRIRPRQRRSVPYHFRLRYRRTDQNLRHGYANDDRLPRKRFYFPDARSDLGRCAFDRFEKCDRSLRIDGSERRRRNEAVGCGIAKRGDVVFR